MRGAAAAAAEELWQDMVSVSCMRHHSWSLCPAPSPAAEAATWANRCEGLRGSLAAKEAHAAALETELGSRPTQQQVDDLRQQAS